MKYIIGIIILFVFLLILSLAGQADYDEAQRQDQEYCDMVAKGVWPDYKNIYKDQQVRNYDI